MYIRHVQKILFSGLAAFLLVSCSNSGGTKPSRVIASKEYSKQVSSTSLNEIKKSDICPSESNIEKESKYKTLMSFANACISKKSWSNVEIIGQRLNALDADLPWGAYYMSVASEGRGHIDRAQWMINLALKKSPKVGLLKYQNGRILWSKKFYKEAIEEIEDSLKMDKNIQDANVFLGQVFLKELKFDKSLRYFSNAYASDSKSYDVLFGLSSCYIELENKDEALGYLSKAISYYPRSIDLRLQEIFVYENQIKDLSITLIKYKNLQALMQKNKVDGQAPFDIANKIKKLETTVNKSTLASHKVGG